jgi:hypothetical protein
MLLIYNTLNILAALFSHTGLWFLVWVAVLVAFSIFIIRISRAAKQPRPWTVRKGECPFCGTDLLGTTQAYQRLLLLDTMTPESEYLCLRCDREKVAGLLSTLGEER